MGLDTKNTQEKTFKTYLNYVNGVHKLMNAIYPTDQKLASTITSSSKFSSLYRIPSADIEKTAKLLRNAWVTESQLEISSLLPDHSKYLNLWMPVHAYYSIYSGIRAYLEATNRSSDGRHAKILDVMGEEMKTHHELFPQPWKMMAVNSINGESTYINLPIDISINKISPLAIPTQQTLWDHYAMLLRTTRIRIVKKKHAEKPRNTKSTKKDISTSALPTTLFHALYRMRVRSNYTDADLFWMTTRSPSESSAFNEALKTITYKSLLIFETLVARRIGKFEFENIATEFISYDKKEVTKNLISKRLEIIRNAI